MSQRNRFKLKRQSFAAVTVLTTGQQKVKSIRPFPSFISLRCHRVCGAQLVSPSAELSSQPGRLYSLLREEVSETCMFGSVEESSADTGWANKLCTENPLARSRGSFQILLPVKGQSCSWRVGLMCTQLSVCRRYMLV